MGKVLIDGELVEYDDEWSLNPPGLDPLKIPNGARVYGCVFGQETPGTNPFRKDLWGVTFILCVLDNCAVPDGNAIIGGTQKRFKVQSDGHDWLVDLAGKPIEPTDLRAIQKFAGKSELYADRITDPKALPVLAGDA